MKVLAFKPNPKNDKQGFVRFDDNTEAWTPELSRIPELVGKELPADWTLRDGPKGKQLLPPGEKRGGGGVWRNTEAGERFVQERMDRRTALMQAVVVDREGSKQPLNEIADEMYKWLRKNLDVPEGPSVSRREHGSTGGDSASHLGSPQGPPSGTSGEEGTSAILPSTTESPETPEGAQGPASPPSRRVPNEPPR